MKLRCSSLPLVSQCAAAAVAPSCKIDLGTAAPSAMGTAVHHVMAGMMLGERPQFPAVAERFQVPIDELQEAVRHGEASLAHVRGLFTTPEVEKPMRHVDGDVELTGTADLIEYNPAARQVRGLDYKTGWLEYDAYHQVAGYAFLGLMTYPEAETAWFGTLHTRGKVLVGKEWTRDDLGLWWAWLTEHMGRQEYRPSYGACIHCKRWAECEAGASLVRQASLALVEFDEGGAADRMTPELATEAIATAKFVEKRAEIVRELVKVYVAKQGGKVEAEDGSTLQLSKVNRRKVTFTEEAAGILGRAIGDDVHKLTVGVGQIEDFCKAHAPRGAKTLLAQRTMDELTSAGAVSIEVSDRLDHKPAAKRIGERS